MHSPAARGLGGDFETHCLASGQIARGSASTALTYIMHNLTMLMMGDFIEHLDLPEDIRARHARLAERRYRQVAEHGAYYAQPHSEPVEGGEKDQLSVSGRRFGTRAERLARREPRLQGGRPLIAAHEGLDQAGGPALDSTVVTSGMMGRLLVWLFS